MRLIGIDPGSVITGFGLVERVGTNCVHVAHGTLRPPKSASLAQRMAFLYEGLLRTLDLHKPDIAAIEQVFISANPKSALVLGQARGVALAAVGIHGLPVQEIAAREVKLAVTGSGQAAKAQVQAMVTRLLDLEKRPAVDAADALAAALCAAQQGPLKALGVRSRRHPTRRRGLVSRRSP